MPGIWFRLAFGFGFIFTLMSCAGEPGEQRREPTGKTEALRVVTLSGFLTELVYALGHGDLIVGRDVTSTYPAEVAELPDLGHVSRLNAEGLIALAPDLILVEERQLGSIQILDHLRGAGIEIAVIPSRFHFANSLHAARHLRAHLPVAEEAIDQLAARLERDSQALAGYLDTRAAGTPAVLFLYARGGGNMLVGGAGTAGHVMIEKAGGRNALASFDNYRAVSAEAIVEAAPEHILMFSGKTGEAPDARALSAVPGMELTPAYQAGRLIVMDGHYLTSFGPRSARAALELAQKLHGP